jgi:ribosomal protein S18 acetylase RimI-like enzyme
MALADTEAVYTLDCRIFTNELWPTGQFAFELTQGFGFVAGEIDGYILVRESASYAEVMRVGVRPEARRMGIARRLLETAIMRIVAPRISLFVRVGNLAAIRLYRDLGFMPIGFSPDYYLDGESGLAMMR